MKKDLGISQRRELGSRGWLSLVLSFGLVGALGCAQGPADSLWERQVVEPRDFTTQESQKPQEPNEPQEEPLESRSLIQVVLDQGVPREPWLQAVDYFERNQNRIKNKDYITVIDFSAPSNEPRKFIIDLHSGEVEALLTAHGVGSDPNHTGRAQRFSNVSGSRMTSLGFYLTAEPYYGKYGLSMRLDGLDASNSRARQRAIVVHGADYVNPAFTPLGRSWGCPAVEMHLVESVVRRLQWGSLMYAWHGARHISAYQRVSDLALGPLDLRRRGF